MTKNNADKLVGLINNNYKYDSFYSYIDNALCIKVYSFDNLCDYDVSIEKKCIFDLLKLVQNEFGRPRFEVVRSWDQCSGIVLLHGFDFETYVIFE